MGNGEEDKLKELIYQDREWFNNMTGLMTYTQRTILSLTQELKDGKESNWTRLT